MNEPKRPLSVKQASRCELAQGKVCACRCGGRLHGAKRSGETISEAFLRALPEDDPHHIPPDEVRRAIIRQCLEYRRALRQAELPLDFNWRRAKARF